MLKKLNPGHGRCRFSLPLTTTISILSFSVAGFMTSSSFADDISSSRAELMIRRARPLIVGETTVFERLPVLQEICEEMMVEVEACTDIPLTYLKPELFKNIFRDTYARKGQFLDYTEAERQKSPNYISVMEELFGPLPAIVVRGDLRGKTGELLNVAHEYGHYQYDEHRAAIGEDYLPSQPPIMSEDLLQASLQAEQKQNTPYSRLIPFSELERMCRDRQEYYSDPSEEFAVRQEIRFYQREYPKRKFRDYMCDLHEVSSSAAMLEKMGVLDGLDCDEGVPILLKRFRETIWEQAGSDLEAHQ